jgi:valyl-tRNA synthetase
MDTRVPAKPTLEGIDDHWAKRWEVAGTYRFDRSRPRPEVFAIDTPPPTVSGELHVGHVLSYTHTDAVARFQRMRGRAVFYPMGWDDNGLPTERRVQQYFGVRCDPGLPYDPEFRPPAKPDPRAPVPVSRPTFVSLCERLTGTDEQAFETLFRRLGLSVDWSLRYTTIDARSRRIAQLAFLRNLARGEAYQLDAPTMWDIDFDTAVAQAEVEDRELPGAYHTLAFSTVDGAEVTVQTTRPELLPACVAVVAHPDDERYAALVGGELRTPLFGVPVPVYAHPLADPAKGSGLAMVCTFGDLTDVTWWRDLALPVRAIIGRDGRLLVTPPAGVPAGPYAQLAGATVPAARRRIVELLGTAGALRGEARQLSHPVKFYEKGDRPLEIVTSRQWYLRNGGRDAELRAVLLARGAQLRWHPASMRARYENWVRGLTGDWLISRQRHYGVPFPVWYPLDDDGRPRYGSPLLPPADALPVDPSTDLPAGYTAGQRGQPGGFVADPDVLDTWATSSLTPQIASRWLAPDSLLEPAVPMDLRPQGHEIIRTWLFGTVVRAHLEHGTLPWSDVAISGWVLDPNRKKMSKSVGNAVTPLGVLERFGSDAVRYWATSARLGVDTAFDDGQLRVGRRLATKLLNASRFVLSFEPTGDSSTGDSSAGGSSAVGGSSAAADIAAAVDRAMLARLAGTVHQATAALERYGHAEALAATETFFWWFCDDHLELVKSRAYGGSGDVPGARSAVAALRVALEVLLRLFAPFLPFVTEEVWSWWRDGSVHHAPWPQAAPLHDLARRPDPALAELASWVLAGVRRAKTAAKVSMRAPVQRLVIRVQADQAATLRHAALDLALAAAASHLEIEARLGEPTVEVDLAG